MNDDEKATFLCLEIISGKWVELGGTREDAKDFARIYFSHFSFDSDDDGSDIELKCVQFFYTQQLLLMSRKVKDDLHKIQEYPPFSTRTLRNFILFLSAFRKDGTVGFTKAFETSFPQTYVYRREDEPTAVFAENSGEAIESAIGIKIIGPNSGIEALPRWRIGTQAEYWYLCFNYGMKNDKWELAGHMSLSADAKAYSLITIRFLDGRIKEVYFDVTNFRRDSRFER